MYSQCLILGFSVVGIFALDKTINSYYSTIDRIAENLHIVELGVKDLIENSVKAVWQVCHADRGRSGPATVSASEPAGRAEMICRPNLPLEEFLWEGAGER